MEIKKGMIAEIIGRNHTFEADRLVDCNCDCTLNSQKSEAEIIQLMEFIPGMCKTFVFDDISKDTFISLSEITSKIKELKG